ncbi:ComF family protein [Phyllobacterium sp. YR531]|uniref:ComF family protein n=1 Tax=Phyllobacterium sp. YR531 TaxID=1144343 RepID=UPI00026F9057|nr:ComF family protein [Phyllobacterium sp. YR531]EJM99217.1 putative amidophosphoribosyltransferase [Phyllobacterium sp. YR531]
MKTIGKNIRTSLGGLARSAARELFGVLFPPVCAGCDKHVAEPGSLCGTCWSKVRFIEKPYCPVLGIPFSHDLGAEIHSAEAIADPPPFTRARSVAVYDGVIRDMVYRLKYNDRTDLSRWMAGWMARAGRELIDDCDVIIPVPLHAHRFWMRRFNQSAELARYLAGTSKKSFEPEALQRIRRTRQQVGLGLNDRLANVRGAFKASSSQEIKVRGRNVLLIDDVYTTGATVKAATRALKRAGAKNVDVLTFGRVLGDELSV